jgi:hypothetical protein
MLPRRSHEPESPVAESLSRLDPRRRRRSLRGGGGRHRAANSVAASVTDGQLNSRCFCASIRFYRDIESSLGHWSGHGKNLFIISISGCGHGTAAVRPDRAGPNCDEPPTKLKVREGRRSRAASPPCRSALTSGACTPPRARTRRAGRDGRRCRAASNRQATSRAAAGPRAPPPGPPAEPRRR